ncbi:MAG: calcineurin-like phosphoesterase family protein [Odoribacter sp.]|nr:calcineurin-like phosphoesterase family protein [Odoribacter sp.]
MKDIKFIGFIILFLAFIGISCEDDKEIESTQTERFVENLYMPSRLSVWNGQEVTIQGKGFKGEDLIIFRNYMSGADTYCEVTQADSSSISFIITDELEADNYWMVLSRGDKEQLLGYTTLRITPKFEIEDKTGATVKGVVWCDGKGIEGVVVSDGYEVTVTDQNGAYWLNSSKTHGYVFISIPSGYETEVEDALPLFWADLYLAEEVCEQHNFELFAVENEDYILVAAADMHLANRNSPIDYQQFEDGFMTDMRKLASTHPDKKIYCLQLGDLSWDAYWYSNNWAIPECKQAIADLPFPMFSVMGNHDNDPYYANDFLAEIAYKSELGPSYYSFNLGKVHYIMLDNVVYVNTGGSIGNIGDRDYNIYVTDDQLEWLKKDLALVDKSTPVVVSMHCPVYTYAWSNGLQIRQAFSNEFGSAAGSATLAACFTGYENVQIMSGHIHINRNIPLSDLGYAQNMIEHNIGAVCGTWWWTYRYASNNVCKDGSPAGYKIFEVNGKDMEWYYVGTGMDKSKQFRTYDVNEVKTYFATNAEVKKYLEVYPQRNYFSNVATNMVYINVWGYEDGAWKISVKEEGTDLAVSQVWIQDPLHNISYDVPRTAANGSATSSFMTSACPHMFAVKASSATSTLEITVTDAFGNEYTERMVRPKAFTTSMD